MRNILAILVLGLFAILGSATARASTITLTFFDNTESVQYSPFGFGPFDCIGEVCPVVVTFSLAPPNTNLFFNIYDQNGVTLSDTISITTPNPNVFNELDTTFVSDTEGVPLTPLVGGTTIIENGSLQTAADIQITVTDDFLVQFQSDVEPVPEPPSVLLLGMGLVMGMALYKETTRPKGLGFDIDET